MKRRHERLDGDRGAGDSGQQSVAETTDDGEGLVIQDEDREVLDEERDEDDEDDGTSPVQAIPGHHVDS